MTLKRSIGAKPEAPFRVSLGPALFHLDDVQDLYQALQEFAEQQDTADTDFINPARVEIRALDATAEKVEDLRDATVGELQHVSLILSRPKIRVDLHIHDAEVIAESDSPAVRKFVEGIREFTRQRRNFWVALRQLFTRNATGLYVIIALIIAVFAVPKNSGVWPSDGAEHALLALFLIALVPFMLLLGYFPRRNAIRIAPYWRKESRGISSQTRSAIWAAVISGIIIGVLGFWAGQFVKK